MGLKSLFRVFFQFPPWFPKYEIMSIKLLGLQETYQTCSVWGNQNCCCVSDIWFGGFQNVENTNFGNPVFNKAEKWNLMAYFPKSGITLKTWNIQLILAKIYLETSKTRPSIFLLKVILNIFHPSPKTPNFLWHRTEACKSFLFKSMLSNLYGEYSTWRIKGSADTQT